ncbi:MAG: GNAT family N-acetyltransferase [candidate division Zixibacteria bacterium]|nr:GNAT family N-acetyltransferase [candidate division Zixibacteria bacterium]
MVKVKRLLPGDEELGQRAINTVKPAQERNHEDVTVDYIHKFLEQEKNVLIVASEHGHPVGFALAYELDRVDRDRPMMLFYEIAVLKSHQRRGIARAMIGKLKEVCREQKVMKMWVCTSKSNTAAMHLYESTGGRPGGGDDVMFVYGSDGLA